MEIYKTANHDKCYERKKRGEMTKVYQRQYYGAF